MNRKTVGKDAIRRITWVSVVCSGLGVLIFACEPRPAVVATTPGELAALLRRQALPYRPTLARLSLDLGHVPCPAEAVGAGIGWNRHDPPADRLPTCGAIPELGPKSSLELLRARRRSIAWLAVSQSPEALHTRALWELFPAPTEAALRRAEGLLEEALAAAPEDPALLNDLGAVRFELALQGDALLLMNALDHFQRALMLRSDPSISRFNTALVASAIPIARTARQAWKSYLDVGDAPGWIAEADERLAGVPDVDHDRAFDARTRKPPESAAAAQRLVSEYPQRAGDYLLDTLLPRWAKAFLSGSQGPAARWLDAAEWIAEAIADRQDDTLAAEVAAGARAAPRRMAEAFARIEVLLSEDLDEAVPGLDAPSHSPLPGVRLLVARARNQLGNVASNAGDHALAARLFTEAESAASAERHPKLFGRILWHRGRSLGLQGRDAEALSAHHRAELIFRRLGDSRRVAALQLMLSEELEALGRTRPAWSARLEAIAVGSAYPSNCHSNIALLVTAESLVSQQLLHAAGLFVDEATAAGQHAGDPITIAEAGELRVSLLVVAGELEAARRGLAGAFEALTALDQGSSYREELEYRLRLIEAQLTTRTDPPPDAGDFAPVFDHFRAEDQQHKVIETYWSRSRRWRALARPELARADLKAALAILMAKNQGLGEVESRLAHSDVIHRVFAELVDIHASRGDALEALVYAECARLTPYHARVYASLGLQVDGSCGALRPSVEERLAEHRPGSSWRIFFSLEDRLLVWTLDARSLRLATHPVSRLELERSVDDVVAAVVRNDFERLREASRDFWIWLDLAAVKSGSEVPLVFIPDGILGKLPFAALIDPRTGRFLVEGNQPSQATSLLLATRTASPDRATFAAGPSLLIADPAFDARIMDLEPLPSARSEVVAIAGLVDRPRTLIGLEATRRTILDSLGEATLFHYAGHAVANAESPFASYLLLAAPGDPPEQQVLRADELLDAAMPELRLAVLSACETAYAGARGASPAAGLAGLAMPFLLRGSVDVVATLRVVDDQATADLMIRFYRHLQAGRSTSASLQAAQLEILQGEGSYRRPPAKWAWVVAFEGLSSGTD